VQYDPIKVAALAFRYGSFAQQKTIRCLLPSGCRSCCRSSPSSFVQNRYKRPRLRGPKSAKNGSYISSLSIEKQTELVAAETFCKLSTLRNAAKYSLSFTISTALSISSFGDEGALKRIPEPSIVRA